jgi:hypothetical protein
MDDAVKLVKLVLALCAMYTAAQTAWRLGNELFG